MQVINRANLSAHELAQAASDLAEHHTLTDVLNWGFNQPKGTVLPQVVAAVVVQDEYSHDVIVPWRVAISPIDPLHVLNSREPVGYSLLLPVG